MFGFVCCFHPQYLVTANNGKFFLCCCRNKLLEELDAAEVATMHVYHSPFSRAYETAVLAVEPLGLTPESSHFHVSPQNHVMQLENSLITCIALQALIHFDLCGLLHHSYCCQQWASTRLARTGNISCFSTLHDTLSYNQQVNTQISKISRNIFCYCTTKVFRLSCSWSLPCGSATLEIMSCSPTNITKLSGPGMRSTQRRSLQVGFPSKFPDFCGRCSLSIAYWTNTETSSFTVFCSLSLLTRVC
jgi:hypothetical protein